MSRTSILDARYTRVTRLTKKECELLKIMCKTNGTNISETIRNCLEEKFISYYATEKQLDFYGKFSNMFCYVLGITNLEAIALVAKHMRARNFKNSFDTNKIIVESLCSLLFICTKDEKRCITSAVNSRKYVNKVIN